MVAKLWENRWVLRALLPSLWFCLRYLPFSQAIRLPILLYKPRILAFKGEILFNTPVSFGLIKLGKPEVSLYPNGGITLESHGGSIIFEGKCTISNNSAISVGPRGVLRFGRNFNATTTFRLACYSHISFGDDVLFGWECLVMDSDFHRLKDLETGQKLHPGYAPIQIGSGCWFAQRSVILRGTRVPDRCVIAAMSLLNKDYEVPQCTLLAGQPASPKKYGVYRDALDDHIEYTDSTR